MSSETVRLRRQDAPVLKRTTDVLTVIGLIVTLCSPIVALAWNSALRLDHAESEGRQIRKDFDQAKLPEEHDRLLRIERDVEWIRKAMEGRRQNGTDNR